MKISLQELKQLEEWRTTIEGCHEKCQGLWDPNSLDEQTHVAESAFRQFAASYAKDLLTPNFPRQNGFFWSDMESAIRRINKLIQEARVETQPASAKTKRKPHRKYLKGLGPKEIASLYNKCAKRLIKLRKENGDIVYEPQRGGTGTGYSIYGRCSLSTFKSWLRKYPDASRPHPINGFHSEMIRDEAAIDKSVRMWKAHIDDYVKQFEKWRKSHMNRPRRDFRYEKCTIIHSNIFPTPVNDSIDHINT